MTIIPRSYAPLALGLALLALPAAAQQYHFERDFDLLRGPTGLQLANVYWVWLPPNPAIPDAANSGYDWTDKCVGDPMGPAVGDGEINADDVICSWWAARSDPSYAQTFTVSMFNADTCTPVGRIGTTQLGAVRFTGTNFSLDGVTGLQVMVTVPGYSSRSPRNHAVIEGDADPAWPGLPITYRPTCPTGAPNCCGALAWRQYLIGLPIDALYSSVDEIACGLAGVDWQDANADGRPDTCWDDADGDGVFDVGESSTGVFDGRSSLTVTKFYNGPTTSGTLSRTVTTALNRVRFTGVRFDLVPGDGYMLTLSRTHRPTVWLPPTP